MKSLVVIVLLCGLAFSQGPQTPASDHQPITFRGAWVGEPLSDYADCSSGKAKVPQGYRTHGDICKGKSGAIFHTKTVGFMNPELSGERFDFEGKTLSRIVLYILGDDWAKLRYDLTEKLGAPQSEVPQQYQNLFGARWEFSQGFWRKGDIVAVAGQKVTTIGACGGFAQTLAASMAPPHPCSDHMQVTITSAQSAGAPDKLPNSLD